MERLATHFGLFLLRKMLLLPLPVQYRIGQGLGMLLLLLGKRWRKSAKRNLQAVFPELTDKQHKQLLRKNFQSVGIGMVETAQAWWLPDNKLHSHITLHGQEHLENALARKHGVILMTAHYTTLEIGGRFVAQVTPLHAMYRKQNNPVFNAAMEDGRNRTLAGLIDRADLRGLLRALRKNAAIWYAMDQDSSGKNCVYTNFFGIPCSTTAATSKIAKMSGAAVLPVTTHRIGNPHSKNPFQYELTIHPPFRNFPSGDDQADTQQLMDHFEQEIRRQPEQYLWLHRRFKSQPEGFPPFYEP